jgi:two-component system, cell cycle sensor histidine kinase and response regulator CckA
VRNNLLDPGRTGDARHSLATDVQVSNAFPSRMVKVLPQSEPPASRQRTILVVDDEDIVRELLVRSLREEGYRVVQASHGAAAIGLLELQAQAFSLVICDLVMPILGGREVSDWMKEHCPELPILFISGYPRAYLEAHRMYDPTVPMLRKPFLPSRLIETVQELVDAGPTSAQRRAEGL